MGMRELLSVSEEELATWDESARAWYAAALQREINLRSPADFAVAHSNDNWRPYRHLAYTSNAIVGMVENDDCDMLLIDQPVRHGKSELCSRWTPAWFVTKYPEKRVLLASYEADFAATWGRKARDIVEEHGAAYGVHTVGTSRAAARWELTAESGGGGMGTAGAGGPITGKGGHLLIVDDPIKNREDAMSPTMRQKVWEWWDSVFLTRREPGAKVLLIMSRWHTDDLMGRVIKAAESGGMRVKRLRMPAIAEDDDLLGRRPGEALCPERYDEEALAAIRKDSPIAWPALYQQRPQPEGGGMFKREFLHGFTRTKIDDEDYLRLHDGRLIALSECTIFGTMDTAYTKSKRSDYTALGIFAALPGDITEMALLAMYRLRAEHAEHAPLLERAWREHQPRWIGLEKITATLSLFSEASRRGIVVRWLAPDRNKVARAETAVSLAMQGRLHIPDTAEWMDDFITEMVTFPTGEHDDMVDVVSYAAAEIAKRSVRGKHRRVDAGKTYEERVWESVQRSRKAQGSHPVLGRFH